MGSEAFQESGYEDCPEKDSKDKREEGSEKDSKETKIKVLNAIMRLVKKRIRGRGFRRQSSEVD